MTSPLAIPADYIPLASALEGVTVFAPAPPPPDARAQDRRFVCPQCGATTAFDPSDASVTCAHCGYTQKVAAAQVGRAAEGTEFTLAILAEKGRGWGSQRRALHCDACGADVSLAPDDLSATCPFCASNQVVARALPEDMIRPGFLVPFKLDVKACTAHAREWLGRGWMHPSGLSALAANAAFKGVYLPFWTFSATINAQWEAEVGYERTESYYDAGAKAWRTRVVIDWRWESGEVSLPIQDLLSGGSRNLSAVLLRKIQPFDLNALVEYDPDFLAGWVAKAYDVPLQEAWDGARTQMREMGKRACERTIHSSHVRNFKMSADFDHEIWRFILLPAFLAAYRYEGKPYQIMVNGQTGQVAGQKPVAWRKVVLAILGSLLPGFVLGLAGVFLGGEGGTLLAIGVVLFLAGLIAAIVILRQAMQAGEA